MAQPYIPPNTRFDVVKFEDLSIETTWTKLGEGSFGFVYRAQYLGLPVAIKEIIPRTDYDMEKYFARECRISREARHPNIVQYIGLCLAPPSIENNPNEYSETQREDEFLYGKKKPCRNVRKSRVLIISEYVPKGNLRNYLVSRSITTKAQPLTWRLRISFAIDIARAVAYLHERKCLHRDLKLDNCLLTENFRVKLCDFGLARFEAKTPEEVRQLSFCGTDGYMSPEVLRGASFDLSTDVYSLGIIFCELISMKLAGASSSSSSICNESAFLQRAPPRYSIKSSDVTSLLETQEEGCPKTFIELSLRCTQVDRHLRPTLKEILSALDSIEQVIIQQEHQKLVGGGGGEAPAQQIAIPSVGSMKFAKSNVKPEGKYSFKRIPSFHGQVIIPKTDMITPPALHPDLQLKISGLEDKDTNSMIDFGINSFFIDPRLLPLINMKKDMDATSDFFGSTLKMPGAVSVRKSFPSAFLNPPVEPMENLVAMQDILARSDTKKSAPSEFSLPEAAVASGVSGLNLSELGTIPTMTTNSIETSSTTDSFKLAMRELTQAYDNSTQASTSELDNAKVDLSGFVSLDSTPTNTHFLENGSTKGSTLTIVPDTFKFNQPSHSESQPQLQPESKGEGKPSNPLPHRFTIFKSHWLANLLNLNQKELSNQEAKTEKSCAACHKPIGSRKTFLRCDDCGENCHKKCSNSLELSHCKR
ncbi:TKL/LISK/LISK-DD1 protein kinase [Puccinia triticina 1-1 BBBD Race 1]|uniref:TKL/LISK/LISK-DD1 protein kinase n=1 Tax=Puccinia triticina (isolate 1-1 / race 1 (BBBD)) TaxID=630390 RepID=A0A180GKS4_PUCT1|nr:TKL/LISK/LISK-DD1 protein kinase [Puccinia triticina 1-1 BBBD Race 1]